MNGVWVSNGSRVRPRPESWSCGAAPTFPHYGVPKVPLHLPMPRGLSSSMEPFAPPKTQKQYVSSSLSSPSLYSQTVPSPTQPQHTMGLSPAPSPTWARWEIKQKSSLPQS